MLKAFFSSAKNYFNFHRNERNGILSILIITVIILIFNKFIPDIIPSSKLNYKPYRQKIAAWKKKLETVPETKHKIRHFYFDPNVLDSAGFIALGIHPKQVKNILRYRRKGGVFKSPGDLRKIYGLQDSIYTRLKSYVRIKPSKKSGTRSKMHPARSVFDFDPNTLSADSLSLLGFSKKTATRIVRYRNKGGRFYRKEDLLKIYDMDSQLYASLAKHIIIKTQPKKQPRLHRDSLPYKKRELHIELNTADTLDLQQLYGIGPGFARRIVKYRTLLGGYVHKEQLLEVWGMDNERFNRFAGQIFVDTSIIRKININTANIKQLIKHPYMDYVLAKRIVLLRKQKGGRFSRIDELREIDLLYDDLYRKLRPYLKAE